MPESSPFPFCTQIQKKDLVWLHGALGEYQTYLTRNVRSQEGGDRVERLKGVIEDLENLVGEMP